MIDELADKPVNVTSACKDAGGKGKKELKNYEKPMLSVYDSLTSITLHGSCLCDIAATDSCPGDDNTCNRGFGGFR